VTRTIVATTLALVAFASNSILCRLALRSGAIDPAEFTAVRLIAGALTLAALVAWRERSSAAQPSWRSGAVLALYALPFSFAYVRLDAGTGALLLFGAVQLTMLGVSLRRGAHPRPLQWVGLVVAFGGVVYLVLPGLTAPPPVSAALMVLAGIAWGLYSLAGRGSADPLGQTAGNFARAVPFGIVACAIAWPLRTPRVDGLVWAALSGAVASGLGYAVWYTALRDLTAVTAAVVQLAVPVIAAIGGILLLDETLTARLVVATVLVLGGIALTIPFLRRAAGVVVIALALGALGCSSAHRPPSFACEAQASIPESLAQPGGVLIFGEIHGAEELPRTIGELACAQAASGRSVQVGLEIPSSDQPVLDTFLDSGDRAALIATPFWNDVYQDGRRSRAMADLIVRLRAMRAAGLPVSVFYFDMKPGGETSRRDTTMAENIEARARQAPGSLTMILTGEIHAWKTKGTPWDPERANMGFVLAQSGLSVRSLGRVTPDGTAWTCGSAVASECGAKPIKATRATLPSGASSGIELLPEPDARGSDGRFAVPTLTASPPARGPE
jgi:drug/metabolite transporter (DMT)-like permease